MRGLSRARVEEEEEKGNDWLPILESHACYWEPICSSSLPHRLRAREAVEEERYKMPILACAARPVKSIPIKEEAGEREQDVHLIKELSRGSGKDGPYLTNPFLTRARKERYD